VDSHFDFLWPRDIALNAESAMSESNEHQQIAFNYGQLHGLKALAKALVRTHPDCSQLLKEFQAACALGLDQLRALPVPHGSNQAYRQLCDEFVVIIGREVRVPKRPRRVP
jgi:hypothetical protein